MKKTRVFRQSSLIEIRRIKKYKGRNRGVFATINIEIGQVIEEVPVIRMPFSEVWWDVPDEKLPTLSNYVFAWHDDGERFTALALGYGSIYNHSDQPNAEFQYVKEDALKFIAIKPIRKNQEITIHYYPYTGDRPIFAQNPIEQ
jgi:uncharacterized protein